MLNFNKIVFRFKIYTCIFLFKSKKFYMTYIYKYDYITFIPFRIINRIRRIFK